MRRDGAGAGESQKVSELGRPMTVIGLRRQHSVGQSVDLGKDYRGLGEGR